MDNNNHITTQQLIPILNDPVYKGIIFDFDETIYYLAIDWVGLKRTLEKTLLEKYKLVIKFTPYIEGLNKIKHQADIYNAALEIIEKFEGIGFGNGYPNTPLLEWIMKANGKTLGIYSMNTSKTLELFFDKYKLKNNFASIVSQQTSTASKPSGEDLLVMIQKWGYTNKEVLYIGNSEHYDKKSGEMAGIRAEIISMK